MSNPQPEELAPGHPLPAQEKKATINEFVSHNDKLLAAVTALLALAIYAASAPLKGLGSLLFVGFFALTVLLWLELGKQFPKNPDSSLSLFGLILSFVSALMIAILVLEFNHNFPPGISLVLFTATALPLIEWSNKHEFLRRVSGKSQGRETPLRRIAARGVVIGAGGLLFLVSWLLTPPLNWLLDLLYLVNQESLYR